MVPMKTTSMTTQICFPPGIPSGELVHTFLRLVLEEFRWFEPMRYGYASLKKKLDPRHVDYSSLVAYYESGKTLCVAARTDRDFFLFHPAKPDVPPYTGGLDWVTRTREANSSSWRSEHVRQVAALMRLLDAPLAYAAWDDDLTRKTTRLIPNPDGFGQTETYTLRDYSDGLEGLFWRNFFGPPFVQMFGERLNSLPGEFKQDLADGIVLVQPYELPTQAGTPEGEARERQLIAQLGPECFYDHERHLKPTRVPDLPRDWLQ
jgi:hypothetical protein